MQYEAKEWIRFHDSMHFLSCLSLQGSLDIALRSDSIRDDRSIRSIGITHDFGGSSGEPSDLSILDEEL